MVPPAAAASPPSSSAAPPPDWARDEAAAFGAPPRRTLHVWIDLDNLPHVPVFAPLHALLRARGHRVSVTARRHAFTLELLALHGIPHRAVGRHPGKAFWRKVTGTLGRAALLALGAARDRPDVAVGHGSRSGAIAARLLGVPALTMFDYEHVHAGAFLSTCRRILLPGALPDEALPAELRDALDASPSAAPPRRRCTVGRFPGFKELLYLDRLVPDPAFRTAVLGLAPDDRRVVAVLREPASTAHYHAPESDRLFAAALDWLRAHRGDAVGVLLPRVAGAPRPDAAAPLDNLLVLARPVDGLQLLAAADLVVSGGGTMNREAALLGVPTWSIFRGTPGALDAALEAEGRLRRPATPEEVAAIPCARRDGAVRPADGRPARAAVVREIEALGAA